MAAFSTTSAGSRPRKSAWARFSPPIPLGHRQGPCRDPRHAPQHHRQRQRAGSILCSVEREIRIAQNSTKLERFQHCDELQIHLRERRPEESPPAGLRDGTPAEYEAVVDCSSDARTLGGSAAPADDFLAVRRPDMSCASGRSGISTSGDLHRGRPRDYQVDVAARRSQGGAQEDCPQAAVQRLRGGRGAHSQPQDGSSAAEEESSQVPAPRRSDGPGDGSDREASDSGAPASEVMRTRPKARAAHTPRPSHVHCPQPPAHPQPFTGWPRAMLPPLLAAQVSRPDPSRRRSASPGPQLPFAPAQGGNSSASEVPVGVGTGSDDRSGRVSASSCSESLPRMGQETRCRASPPVGSKLARPSEGRFESDPNPPSASRMGIRSAPHLHPCLRRDLGPRSGFLVAMLCLRGSVPASFVGDMNGLPRNGCGVSSMRLWRSCPGLRGTAQQGPSPRQSCRSALAIVAGDTLPPRRV